MLLPFLLLDSCYFYEIGPVDIGNLRFLLDTD